MCFLAKKVEGEELDQLGQYLELRDTVDSILAKERIYGHNWLSTGGEFTTRVRFSAHTLKGVCFKFILGNIYNFAIFELVSQIHGVGLPRHFFFFFCSFNFTNPFLILQLAVLFLTRITRIESA